MKATYDVYELSNIPGPGCSLFKSMSKYSATNIRLGGTSVEVQAIIAVDSRYRLHNVSSLLSLASVLDFSPFSLTGNNDVRVWVCACWVVL